MRSATALVVAVVAVGAAGAAAGEPDDHTGSDTNRAFLASLQAAGITFAQPDLAVLSAKTVCHLIGNGEPSPQIVDALQSRNPGLTVEHATQFVGIAVSYYCPDELVPSSPTPGR